MLLKQIIQHKHKEIARAKQNETLFQLKKRCEHLHKKSRSLFRELSRSNNHPHLICEMKMASPSEGVMQNNFKPKNK